MAYEKNINIAITVAPLTGAEGIKVSHGRYNCKGKRYLKLSRQVFFVQGKILSPPEKPIPPNPNPRPRQIPYTITWNSG